MIHTMYCLLYLTSAFWWGVMAYAIVSTPPGQHGSIVRDRLGFLASTSLAVGNLIALTARLLEAFA